MVSHSHLKNNKQTTGVNPQTETDLLGSIPTRTFCFVFVCALAFSWKQILRTKEKPETKTPEARAAHKGLQARPTGFSTLGWMGLRGLRSCPHLQCSETWSCLCRSESPSSDSMGRGQGGGWQRGLRKALCALTGEWLILQTQRVAFLAGAGTTNLRWGRGLNKTSL